MSVYLTGAVKRKPSERNVIYHFTFSEFCVFIVNVVTGKQQYLLVVSLGNIKACYSKMFTHRINSDTIMPLLNLKEA